MLSIDLSRVNSKDLVVAMPFFWLQINKFFQTIFVMATLALSRYVDVSCIQYVKIT